MSRGDWICPNCNTKDFTLLVEVNYCKECKRNGLEIEMEQDGTGGNLMIIKSEFS